MRKLLIQQPFIGMSELDLHGESKIRLYRRNPRLLLVISLAFQKALAKKRRIEKR